MAKKVEDIENETEDKKEILTTASENEVYFDGKYYIFPEIDVVLDAEGNTEPVKIRAQRMFNMTIYNKALYRLQDNMDLTDFAQVTFKSMIIEPAKAKNFAYFNYDQDALSQIASILIDIMGLPSKNIKRNLNLVLK